MKRLGLCVMAVAVGGFGQSGALPSTPNAGDSKEILRRAPLAYYSLKREGLIDFLCQITPDWDSFYKSVETDAVGREQLLPILKTRLTTARFRDSLSLNLAVVNLVFRIGSSCSRPKD